MEHVGETEMRSKTVKY